MGSELPLSNSALIEVIKGVMGKGASFRFRASGWSMSPFIRDGDILTLIPMERGPSIGDVVAFINPMNGKLVVHRLIGKNNGLYRFKGDNLNEIDGDVPYEGILGKVSRVERLNKTVRFGLGLERLIISLMSRANVLVGVTHLIYIIYRSTRNLLSCL
jgi:hypothetical protein